MYLGRDGRVCGGILAGTEDFLGGISAGTKEFLCGISAGTEQCKTDVFDFNT